MGKRTTISAALLLAATVFCGGETRAQIASTQASDGRKLFVNAEPPSVIKFAPKPRTSIYLPGEISFTGRDRAAVSLDKDGVDKLVKEAADRHHVDEALIRAVIQTESGWNPSAVSRKGAVGLMQLIPTTAQRFGVNDMFNPKQNVDAGVRYLKTLLERYNGNLQLALAAYNAGEGAVDRAGGIPAFRETRNYVQRVQEAYYRPGSGRLEGGFIRRISIRKETNASGRTIFTNE